MAWKSPSCCFVASYMNKCRQTPWRKDWENNVAPKLEITVIFTHTCLQPPVSVDSSTKKLSNSYYVSLSTIIIVRQCLIIFYCEIISALPTCLSLPFIPPQNHPLVVSLKYQQCVCFIDLVIPQRQPIAFCHLKMLWSWFVAPASALPTPSLTPEQTPSLHYLSFPEQIFDMLTCGHGLLKLLPVPSAFTQPYIFRMELFTVVGRIMTSQRCSHPIFCSLWICHSIVREN